MSRKPRKTPGGWGTVELLPSGRYRAFYRVDGSRYGAPHTFDTKAAAQGWLAQERADRSRGTWQDPRLGDVTLGAYIGDWLESRPDLAPRTVDLYRRTLQRRVLAPVTTSRGRIIDLGRMRVADVTPAVVRTWYAAVFAATRTAAEARLRRDAARRAHPAREWARERGLAAAATGRLSPAVLSAWRSAGSPTSTLAGAPDVVPDAAGRTAAAHAYRVLRTVMGTALHDGLIATNPCQIPNAGAVRHRERATASPAEVRAIAATMPGPLAAAVTIAAWSSLRYGELFALARRHVDVAAGTVSVERALVCVPGEPIRFGPPKTERSRRVVHLPGFVHAALVDHLDTYVAADPEALLFAIDGAPVTNARVSFLFRRARAAIDRPELTWHDLRHTGATLAYRAGASVPEVQARLGHSTMRAAAIYAHLAEGADRSLADRIDALFGAGAPSVPLLSHPAER
ncbi:tyrosine-type recombinase/integrase [Pseudolysinimonas sp.]|jgi:integrase|uniref:tyrosine-type recombinase/integrase n=1 Tax=Pseudolysinimonas sp. TaxID=2680009 RepID=UPI0037848FD6